MKSGKVLINFKKAHSLISKVGKMVEKEEYVPKIMQQNLAVMGLLRSVHQMLLEKHLQSCFSGSNKKTEKKMKDEILKVVKMK